MPCALGPLACAQGLQKPIQQLKKSIQLLLDGYIPTVEKERSSGSYRQAAGFLVIQEDLIFEIAGQCQSGSRCTGHAGWNLLVKELATLGPSLLTLG